MLKNKTRQTALFKVEKDLAHLAGGPQKSSKTFPNWLKKLPKTLGNEVPEHGATVKGCVPFIEAMSQGATFSLWCDLRVVVREHFIPTDENGEEFIPTYTIMDYPEGNLPRDITQLYGTVVKDEQGRDRTIAHLRSGGLGSAFMFPDGYWQEYISAHAQSQVKGFKGRHKHPPQVFKLNSPWIIDTPRGYSTYFKNPCNKFDSPLTIFEGFVDTDYYNKTAINFPCFWNGTEEGVFTIEQGTPVCQMLFIKRDTQIDVELETYEGKIHAEIAPNQAKLSSKFVDRYRNLFWHKNVEGRK